MICLSAPLSATAQTARVDPIQLTGKSGYVEFVTRQRGNSQESKVGTGDQKFKETIMEENFKLGLDGYVYHPNFLEFNVGGLFGLRQADFKEDFDGQSYSSGDNGTVLEFDVEGLFFKKKPYPATVFAHRHQSLEARPFLPSLNVTTNNYGATWQYVSDKTPTNFQFSHTDVLLEAIDGVEEGRQKNDNLRFETAYRFSQYNALSLIYLHESVDQQPFDLQYDADEVTTGHRWDFGDQHQHRLESEVNYRDQRGTFGLERARWREILRLQHTESLRSWYQFELIDRSQTSILGVPPIKERSYSLLGTIEHQLYESLISQFTTYAQRQEFRDGAEIDRLGALASFDYRKRNPWGVLQANYRPRVQTEDHNGAERGFEVFRESHTFRDPDPATLMNLNIELGSIQVTAEDLVTVYSRGRDYEVRQLPDRVEIRRIPTGRIADGQTVLISYTYVSGGSFRLDTVNQEGGIRQNFAFGLSPYYRLRWQDQSLSPETSTGAIPEDITAHLIGAEFERWGFLLQAEYEDFDSSVNPFEAFRLNGEYTRRFKLGSTATIKANWTDVSYSLPDEREVTFFTLEGRYRHPITRNMTFEGSSRYRTLDDSLIQDKDKGVELDLSLEWILRQTEVRVTYRLTQFEDNFAKTDSSALFLQVRRNF